MGGEQEGGGIRDPPRREEVLDEGVQKETGEAVDEYVDGTVRFHGAAEERVIDNERGKAQGPIILVGCEVVRRPEGRAEEQGDFPRVPEGPVIENQAVILP